MPALGYTQTEEAIAAELEDIGIVDFLRAYMNRWVRKDTVPEWSIIKKTDWEDRRVDPIRPDGPVIFAVASAWPDAQETSIIVLGQIGNQFVGQVVEHKPGASWAVDALSALTKANPNLGVVIDRGGPAGRLIAPLTDADVPLIEVGMQETARAFGLFLTEVAGDAPRFCHFDQPELTRAVATANKRPLGDGFTWARKQPTDTSPVEAMTIGLYQYMILARLNAPVTSVYEERGMVEL
jgi:hypothetical protein